MPNGNQKFLIYQILQFGENNINQAHEELIKLLAGGSLLSNGEIEQIEESLKNIKKLVVLFRENIEKIRELDAARNHLVETIRKHEAVV